MKISFKGIGVAFSKLNNSIKIHHEFEKESARLNAIMGKDLSKSEDIKEFIKYMRDKYSKMPNKYIGDHNVLSMLNHELCLGFTLNQAMSRIKYR